MKYDVPFSILKFTLTERGIDVKLDVPDEKYDIIQSEFKKESIRIKNHVVEIEENLCIDCGECIALCNTGALYFDGNFKRGYEETKCVGCQLCIDACPRQAIIFR